jgi:hypothetical protein
MPEPDLQVQQAAGQQRILPTLHGRSNRRLEELHHGIRCGRRCLRRMHCGLQDGFKDVPMQLGMQHWMSVRGRLRMPGVCNGDVPGTRTEC